MELGPRGRVGNVGGHFMDISFVFFWKALCYLVDDKILKGNGRASEEWERRPLLLFGLYESFFAKLREITEELSTVYRRREGKSRLLSDRFECASGVELESLGARAG